MKVHFYLTKKDIVEGMRGNPYACPVFHCIDRRLKNHSDLTVTINRICMCGRNGDLWVCELPETIKEMIRWFDRQPYRRFTTKNMRPMVPTRFTLNIPKEFVNV